MRAALMLCAFVVVGTSVVEAQRGGRRPRRTPVPRVSTPQPQPSPVTGAPTPVTGQPAATGSPVAATDVPPVAPASTPAPAPVSTAGPTAGPTDAPATPTAGPTAAPALDFGEALTRPGQGIVASAQAQYLPVVAAIVRVMEQREGALRPLLVRLAWHSLATHNGAALPLGGSNGGCVRTRPELALADNRGVDVAVEALEAVKAGHPFITYADLYQLAGNTALEYMGSPSLFWRPGRRDFVAPAETETRCVSDNERLPQKRINNDVFPHLDTLGYFFDKFAELGISLDTNADALAMMVSLMGGHNMGAMHLDISGNEGVWTANNLVFGNEYFFNLVTGPWGRGTAEEGPFDLQYRGGPRPGFVMLPIDMVIRQDSRLLALARQFAVGRALYETHFVAAWRLVQEVGVDFQ